MAKKFIMPLTLPTALFGTFATAQAQAVVTSGNMLAAVLSGPLMIAKGRLRTKQHLLICRPIQCQLSFRWQAFTL
jgi:hypothetical protein